MPRIKWSFFSQENHIQRELENILIMENQAYKLASVFLFDCKQQAQKNSQSNKQVPLYIHERHVGEDVGNMAGVGWFLFCELALTGKQRNWPHHWLPLSALLFMRHDLCQDTSSLVPISCQSNEMKEIPTTHSARVPAITQWGGVGGWGQDCCHCSNRVLLEFRPEDTSFSSLFLSW
jgi:hypothetical protein